MLAAVITAKDLRAAAREFRGASAADLIELRLDYVKNLDKNELGKIIEKSERPLLVTCRRSDGGGLFKGSESERIAILRKSVEFGADYVDIEHSSGDEVIKELIKNKKNTKIIVSYHNLNSTPANIESVYNKIKKLNPDLIKIVTNANSVTDNFRVFDLVRSASAEKRKIIAFCMGSYGQFSRVLSCILGSQITYASIEKGKESATGQYALDEINEIFRIKKLNDKTKIAGLIGNPVEHSSSHVMHNAAFGSLGINAVYLKFRVDRLGEFIDYMRTLNTLGFSVTIPHKIEVIKYLDEIDKKAKEIGAVNTIVCRGGKFIGYNTDCSGAMAALKSKTNLRGKNVVVLGAGGSTRAVAYELIENGAKVTILNRTVGNARAIAEDFNCSYGSLDDLINIRYDVLINTTPVGMYPYMDSSPIPKKLIKRGSVVFDIVFNPYKTKLLEDAEKNGCSIIHGMEMLAYGNALQFELWTGKNAPVHLMRKQVMDYLKNAGNKN